MATFYNNNHTRDRLTGRIIKRDYSTFEAKECSCCGNPIFGKSAFSAKGFNKDAALILKSLNYKVTKNTNYCIDCKLRFDEVIYKAQNKSKQRVIGKSRLV